MIRSHASSQAFQDVLNDWGKEDFKESDSFLAATQELDTIYQSSSNNLKSAWLCNVSAGGEILFYNGEIYGKETLDASQRDWY